VVVRRPISGYDGRPGHDVIDGARLRAVQLPVADLVDLLLLGAMRRRATALLIQATGDEHEVTIEEPSGARTVTAFPAALGDALVARLAILARLDVAAGDEQVGRLVVRGSGEALQLMVAMHAAAAGLSVEARRMAARAAAPPPAAPALTPTEVAAALEQAGYRVLAELGRGGMGIVYRAEHVLLGRPVAVKVLYRDLAADQQFADRFVREARAASRARHPGIVDVTDFGVLRDGRAFMVMELLGGETLEALIAKGPLPADRAVEIARRIALALGAAHRCGVVHRDLKPANVFLLEGDAVKLCDFGAAKLEEGPPGATPSSVTQPGQVFGTPHYMSPEHARGLATDLRTDIYALGCVLFEMVTGNVPYEGETPLDVLSQHVTAPIPEVTGAYGPLPHALEHTIRRAMAKEREHRHQTTAELVADLDRSLAALARSGWRRWLSA
jgi:serine/threonine-protein kinase